MSPAFLSGFSETAFASGLPADGRLMTYQESIDCFGTTIPVRYLDRSGVYHDEIASLVTNNAPYKIGQTSYIDSESYLVESRGIVLYEFHTEYSTPVNITPAQVTVKLQPEYSIFDTEYIFTAIGISTDTDTSLAAYNSPTWTWVYAGQTVVFDSVATATNNVLPNFYLKNSGNYFVGTSSGNTKFNFVPAYMTSQAVTSGYSTEATFDHVWGNSSGGIQTIYIAIGFPYVSSGALGATGTPTTTVSTTTQNINVNVDVDLEQTNGLLGSIITAVGNVASAIITGIQNLFVPTSEQLNDFLDDLEQLLYSKVAPLYDAVAQINRVFTSIRDNGTDTVVYVPPVTISHGNDSMILDFNDENLGGIPLYHDVGGNTASSSLLLAAKKAVDIVCTLAFINMCRRKLDLILNPESETFIEGGTDF